MGTIHPPTGADSGVGIGLLLLTRVTLEVVVLLSSALIPEADAVVVEL